MLTREQKINIVLEELENEITIATYQENRVRRIHGGRNK